MAHAYFKKLGWLVVIGVAQAQPWSTFLDPSRAINWSAANQVGFAIPAYTVPCATQPSLNTGTAAASANASSIQASIASCDPTHNVVNLPAGTWYVTSISLRQSNVVIRGAGPNSTTLIPTSGFGCAGGQITGICIIDPNNISFSSAQVLPGGSQACSWTAGYSQGTTSITLSSCGGAPPLNWIIALDQANDTSDTGGIYICDDTTSNCPQETGGANDGRIIGGITYSQQQYTRITGVTSLGGGSYTVTISPGVYFTNIRSSQTPSAYWFESLQNDGVENLSIDGTTMSSGAPTNFGNIGLQQCAQCWLRNIRSLNAGRYHMEPALTFQNVIRDSYFYGALGGASQSYAVEIENTSGTLVENNIMQQTTVPIMLGVGTGNVFDYNFSLANFYTNPATYASGSYFSHNAANNLNLWEGNNFVAGPWGDNIHGSSAQVMVFRSMSPGWYTGKSNATQPFVARDIVRIANLVGNVFGQPGYHTQYQSYATSTTAGVGATLEDSSTIYSFGWITDARQGCTVGAVTNGCDPLSFSTAMRWGNWDSVTNGVKWDTTEASPAAVPYVNVNFSSTYFSTLAHTLPASLFYTAKPSWWPATKSWPPIGPDVTTGNVGLCNGGTYAGAQATTVAKCTGGTFTSPATAYQSHVVSLPAQDCYVNVMGGPLDGSGSALPFDYAQCVNAPARPVAPTMLTVTIQ